MPISGIALIVAAGVGLSIWGGTKIVHGVKHVAHKLVHVAKKTK